MSMRSKYDLSNAMNYKGGGFTAMRHNNVWHFKYNPLKTIQNDIEIKAGLQEIDNVRIDPHTRDELRRNIWDECADKGKMISSIFV